MAGGRRGVHLPDGTFLSEDRVREYVANHWMGLGDTSLIKTPNPLEPRTRDHVDRPDVHLLDVLRRPEYFYGFGKLVLNKTLAPFQLAILRELWHRPFPLLMASRGGSKSFMLGLYAVLKSTLLQGSKVVIIGASFRQAKSVFNYAQDIWDNAPVLRDIAGHDKNNGVRRDVDRCTLRIGESIISALPLGDGERIRGERGNTILADEFGSIPVHIFETVVRGFAAVSKDPVVALQREARLDAMKDLGLYLPEEETYIAGRSNQTVIAGTATWQFSHFFEYWKRYKAIVESRGDEAKLNEIFNNNIPEGFDWRDFAVIRIPYKYIPRGFMDTKQIAQAKATVHSGTFAQEYCCVFSSDSNGFYKRSLIESCIAGRPRNPIIHESSGVVKFCPVLGGSPDHWYVLAVDPASEHDNLSMVVLECWPEHRRIVYVWTTNRKRFKAQVERGMTDGEQDYYYYAARKIRKLFRAFNIRRIAMDSQGGGVGIMEALANVDVLRAGERAILPVEDPEKPKPTDGLPGDHILEMVNFASADWVSEANHGMRNDLEKQFLLFPDYDPAVEELSLEDDRLSGRVKLDPSGKDVALEGLYDTLSDCMYEIEQLKDELTSIVITRTAQSNRDRWDTPETKLPGGKKGRLRKDRYSALLMANMAARTIMNAPEEKPYTPMGGFANRIAGPGRGHGGGKGDMWVGPSWWVEGANQAMGAYGIAVRR